MVACSCGRKGGHSLALTFCRAPSPGSSRVSSSSHGGTGVGCRTSPPPWERGREHQQLDVGRELLGAWVARLPAVRNAAWAWPARDSKPAFPADPTSHASWSSPALEDLQISLSERCMWLCFLLNHPGAQRRLIPWAPGAGAQRGALLAAGSLWVTVHGPAPGPPGPRSLWEAPRACAVTPTPGLHAHMQAEKPGVRAPG